MNQIKTQYKSIQIKTSAKQYNIKQPITEQTNISNNNKALT